MYSIMSSVNSDNLNSFPTLIPANYFSSLFAVAGTSKTILIKGSERGYYYLVPDIRGNAFGFSLLSMMLAIGLSYMAFIMLCFLCVYFLESFYHR